MILRAFLKKILPQSLLNRYEKYLEYKNRDILYYYRKENLAYAYRKKQGLINHAAVIETLALRGSNTDCGFFPQCIDNSYNLGLTSTDVYIAYHLYLNCKGMLPHLKNIVYYVNGFVPGMSLIRIKERNRMVSYKYFFDIPYQEDGFIDEEIEEKILEKCRKFRMNVPNNYWGYEKKQIFMRERDAEVRAKKILKDNRREPDQMIWVKKIIDQIIEDKKNIYMIIPPYSAELKNHLPPKEELYKKTYALLSNYKDLSNVQLIDLYDSDLFDDSDMDDHDHLNIKGARKCTAIVKGVIDKKDNRIKV
jgi:hypothetical protein